MSPRGYGDVEARRTPEAREARYTAALTAMADDRSPWTPNQIGMAMQSLGVVISTPSGFSGKVLGHGSSIAPTLRAMLRRGWITPAPRPGGLSGRAFVITREGLRELERRQQETSCD